MPLFDNLLCSERYINDNQLLLYCNYISWFVRALWLATLAGHVPCAARWIQNLVWIIISPLLSNPEIKNIFHKLVSPVRAASYGIWFVAARIYGALLSEINPVVSYINLGVSFMCRYQNANFWKLHTWRYRKYSRRAQLYSNARVWNQCSKPRRLNLRRHL